MKKRQIKGRDDGSSLSNRLFFLALQTRGRESYGSGHMEGHTGLDYRGVNKQDDTFSGAQMRRQQKMDWETFEWNEKKKWITEKANKQKRRVQSESPPDDKRIKVFPQRHRNVG